MLQSTSNTRQADCKVVVMEGGLALAERKPRPCMCADHLPRFSRLCAGYLDYLAKNFVEPEFQKSVLQNNSGLLTRRTVRHTDQTYHTFTWDHTHTCTIPYVYGYTYEFPPALQPSSLVSRAPLAPASTSLPISRPSCLFPCIYIS
jgi:hypothetical protein